MKLLLLNSYTSQQFLLMVAILFGYSMGSVPYGILLVRRFGGIDISRTGSGNIGTTNVFRAGYKILALLTLFCDVSKGTLAVILTTWLLGADAAIFAGAGALIGHVFPIWIWGKGGKGIATYAGILLGFSWLAVFAFCVTWLTSAAFTRISSISSLLALFVSTLVICLSSPDFIADRWYVFCLLSLLVLTRHKANLERLYSGSESRLW